MGLGTGPDPAQFGRQIHLEGFAVDLAQVFIFVSEWIFFAAWGLALVAVSVVAFGKDIISLTEPQTAVRQTPHRA